MVILLRSNLTRVPGFLLPITSNMKATVLVFLSIQLTITAAQGGGSLIPLDDDSTTASNVAGSTNSGGLILDDDSLETKIVGGQTITDGTIYPWYVHAVKNGELCGGSLIHPDVALTAAHCGAAFNKGALLGATRLYGITSQQVNVKKVEPHPNYKAGPELNDIMLVLLKEVKNGTQLMKLNFDSNKPSDGLNVDIIGFGKLKEDKSANKNEPVSQTLQHVTLKTVSHTQCTTDYSVAAINQTIMLCAGIRAGGKDSCSGDSGGPLFTGKLDMLVSVP